MTQDQHKLEPCPFCGATANDGEGPVLRVGELGYHFVFCNGCGASGPENAFFQTDAIPAWNRRAHLQQRPLPVREGTDDSYALVRSIIHECPALKLPQTFMQRLGMTAQIVPLRGLTQEQAQAIVDRLNAASPSLPVREEPTRWHELKTDPFVWDDVAAERKTFEIRLNDRGFKVGDGLLLRKTRYTGADMKVGHPLVYEGEPLRRVITHILWGPVYGLADRWAILSIAPLASSPSVQNMGEGETGKDGVKACRYTNEPGGACWREGKAVEICTCHSMTDNDFAESVKRHAECRAPLGNAGVLGTFNDQPKEPK